MEACVGVGLYEDALVFHSANIMSHILPSIGLNAKESLLHLAVCQSKVLFYYFSKFILVAEGLSG